MFHVTTPGKNSTMSLTSINQRVQKHRQALRQAGLRPVQLWVPDTRRADFARLCHEQCLRVAELDLRDPNLHVLMEEATADLDGWKG